MVMPKVRDHLPIEFFGELCLISNAAGKPLDEQGGRFDHVRYDDISRIINSLEVHE
jgi:hypothetical protein